MAHLQRQERKGSIMIDWTKPFLLGYVYRFDLQRIGLTNMEIEKLSDLDMLQIVNDMLRMYLQGDFWKHLENAVSGVLLNKED